MGFDIGTIGQGAAMQAASGLVGTGLGLLLEGHNDRRQLTQQGKLNELSVKSQKELLEAQRQKELQMWQDTNYSAQIEQMKKAGVNPALLYGQSGGGGTTTGGSGQGINNTGAPTGGGEILAMQGMGLQSQMIQANIELAKSQANLNNVKAGNEGVEPSYDIRTDKWDAAIDAMEKVSESKRDARLKRLEDKKQRSDDGLTSSPQGGDTAQ